MPAVEAGAKLCAAGSNSEGQCGAGPEDAVLQPVPVGLGALAGAAVQQIAQGYQFTLLLILGRLYHAGRSECGQRGKIDWDPHPDFAEIPLPALAVEVVCGAYFALALLENGALVSWGRNSEKELGRTGDGSVPLPLEGLEEVLHVYAGYNFAFVLLAGGEVWAWGCNARGQLCLGRAGAAEGSPQRVAALCGRAAALALSGEAGIALLTDDSAVAWGRLNGKLADGTGDWDEERGCLPLRLQLSAVRAVGAGYNYLCAHLKAGPLVSWGRNVDGRLGRDGLAHVPTAVPFPGGEQITEFICLAYCLFAKGPSGWAACGLGLYGLPFGESARVSRLTLIPRWVPCPWQGGTCAQCAFYVCAPASSGQSAAAMQGPPAQAIRAASTSGGAEGQARIAELEAALAAERTRAAQLDAARKAAEARIAELEAAAAGAPRPRPTRVTFEESNFLKVYQACTPEQYKRVLQIDNAVVDAFDIISKEPGNSSKQEFHDMHDAMSQVALKRDGVEFAVSAQRRDSTVEAQAAAVTDQVHTPVTRACIFYTAGKLKGKDGQSRCARIEGRQMEFCSMLSWMIRSDRVDILTAIMPFFRALCSYTNADREEPAITREQWEMVKDVATVGTDAEGKPKQYKVLYRGGSLKSDCFSFFEPGRGYRAAAYLSTTPLRKTAQEFIERTVDETGRCEKGLEPVLWKLLVDDEKHCLHATYIQRSLVYAKDGDTPGAAIEAEFLFSAYSWFEVVSVYRGACSLADPTIITVRCAVDNKMHPTDAPTAPWN